MTNSFIFSANTQKEVKHFSNNCAHEQLKLNKKFIKVPKTEQLKWVRLTVCTLCLPGGSEVKASACNAGDLGLIPGSGRSPGEGNGNPLQYSCLENPMDGGAWWAIVHGVAKSLTRLTERLN